MIVPLLAFRMEAGPDALASGEGSDCLDELRSTGLFGSLKPGDWGSLAPKWEALPPVGDPDLDAALAMRLADIEGPAVVLIISSAEEKGPAGFLVGVPADLGGQFVAEAGVEDLAVTLASLRGEGPAAAGTPTGRNLLGLGATESPDEEALVRERLAGLGYLA